MWGQTGFSDVDERLKELSAQGDDLEWLVAVVKFELFRPDLARAVLRSRVEGRTFAVRLRVHVKC